jgi:S-methylmethionine-dependent homocysteine/selenocysteine methylase
MIEKSKLPQLNGQNMACGWGFETWLQFKDGFELRHFCAFELLNDTRGLACLTDYHRKLVEGAVEHGFGVINDGLHYRASSDWGNMIGFSREALAEINIRGIEFYKDFAREYQSDTTPMLVGGSIGPRGDAYDIGRVESAAEAEDYHSEQIITLRDAGADLVTAATFSNVEEAIGFARAAKAAHIPSVISMVAKGGNLNDGTPLADAVTRIDAATGNAPLYYMVNCTHPTEFEPGLTEGEWTKRLGGFLPNAVAMELLSLCSLGHLEDGDPEELGGQMAALSKRFPHVYVWGGCCGTDGRHIGQIARQVSEARNSVAA